MSEIQPSPRGSSNDLSASVEFEQEPPPVPALQALTEPSAGLTDASGFIEAVRSAAERVAMLRRAGQPVGTAALVGPDLLLTAAHVLDSQKLPPSIENLVAVFDYRPRPETSPAETGIPIPVTEFLTGSLPSDAEVASQHLDPDAPPNRLDFAVLRLTHPLPDAGRRGHYYLDPDDYRFSPVGVLFIFQHPLGSTLMVSTTSGAIRNAAGTRIRYQANTMLGSSGSPVIDTRGRLVAIHHYSAGKANQGVPSSRIAIALQTSGHAWVLRPASDRPGAGSDRLYPAEYQRLRTLGKYQEADEVLRASAATANPAAVAELAQQLRRMGRFTDADRIEGALSRGREAVRDVVAQLRQNG